MTLEVIGISVLWLFLFGYIIVGSIDFGAGFFSAYSHWANKQHILHRIIQRYLSPVWEVTNLFLCRHCRLLSENGVLLRFYFACPGEHLHHFVSYSRLVLCVSYVWGDGTELVFNRLWIDGVVYSGLPVHRVDDF